MAKYYVYRDSSDNRVEYDGDSTDRVYLVDQFTRSLLTGLISVYDFEETVGSVAYDTTASSNDLTITGATLNQTGKLNQCFDYSGSFQYCVYNQANNNLAPTSNHSISAWIKREGNAQDGGGGTQGAGQIMSKYYSSTGNRQYTFGLINDNNPSTPNRVQVSYYDTSNTGTFLNYDPPTDIWTNNWMHVVYTRSGADMSFYVNGLLVATSSGGNGSMRQATTYRDYIGACNRSSYTPDQFFNGKIDQVAVWSVELSHAQVRGLYNVGAGLPYTLWV
jgi:hypothetical protein